MSYWKQVLLGILLICLGLTGAMIWSGAAQYNHMLKQISITAEEEPARHHIDNKSTRYHEDDQENELYIPPEEKPTDNIELSLDPPKENVESIPPESASSGNKSVNLKQEPFMLLLYGLDKRKQIRDKGRPDTLMLVLTHPALNRIQLISIPRDAYVPIPGHGYDKLNHSFSKGGVDLTIKTLEKWLKIKLKGYVAIDFAGFVKLIDLFGGIDMHVDRDMAYHDPEDGTTINLKQGEQVLSGEKALQFVRFRYSNAGSADSDYNRMGRQQAVLKQVAKKITTIPSLFKLFAIKQVMEAHIQTTLTPTEINSLIRWLVKAEPPEIESTSMMGRGKYRQRLWYELISDAEIKRIQTLIKEFMEVE